MENHTTSADILGSSADISENKEERESRVYESISYIRETLLQEFLDSGEFATATKAVFEDRGVRISVEIS